MLWKKFNQNIAVEVTSSQLSDIFKFIQQGLSSINDQGGYFTFFIGYTPNQREGGSWKELAEAHLRERVRNPHDYRALSIELYAMEKAGYDWRRDFSSYGELSRFLEQLYNTKLRTTKLTERINDLDLLRKKYEIEEAVSNWGNMTPNFDPNWPQKTIFFVVILHPISESYRSRVFFLCTKSECLIKFNLCFLMLQKLLQNG